MTAQQRKRKTYQSFPDQAGGSQSLNKLVQLRLPALAGKSFLDVGCNEGFFCGFAKHQGAARVVGIDMSAPFIEAARARFPDCEFLQQSWDRLPDESFDVILLASAIHYADDQPALIARLMEHLNPEGTLVLEIGVVGKSSANEWVAVKRSIDTRLFPTMTKLQEVLQPYAWKHVGKSVDQTGDPIPRTVVHIRKRRPVAYLLMMPPTSGKTNVANGLFPKAGVRKIMGDQLLRRIVSGDVAASEPLKLAIEAAYDASSVNWARVVETIFMSGVGNDYIALWAGKAASQDIAFDGYIPARYHEEVVSRLKELGYFPIRLEWERMGDPLISPDTARKHAEAYFAHLAAQPRPAEPPAAPKPATAAAANPAAAPGTVRARGFVDRINVSQHAVTVWGWCVTETGAPPESFAVHMGGRDYICAPAACTARPDVQTKLGLASPDVGYMLKIPLDQAPGEDQLAGFAVHAAAGGVPAGAAFTLGAKVRAVLAA